MIFNYIWWWVFSSGDLESVEYLSIAIRPRSTLTQSPISVLFSRTDAGLCIYYLFVWQNLNDLHDSLWITFPTQLCLVLHSFNSNLLHSLIIWLIILSLSPHNLHLHFCCILATFALTEWVLFDRKTLKKWIRKCKYERTMNVIPYNLGIKYLWTGRHAVKINRWINHSKK